MRKLIVFPVIATVALACGREPSSRQATSSKTISGVVLERLDAPPYTLMRLDTGKERVWVAVPLSTARQGGKITVMNGATVRDFDATSVGRRFDSVVFGVLERK